MRFFFFDVLSPSISLLFCYSLLLPVFVSHVLCSFFCVCVAFRPKIRKSNIPFPFWARVSLTLCVVYFALSLSGCFCVSSVLIFFFLSFRCDDHISEYLIELTGNTIVYRLNTRERKKNLPLKRSTANRRQLFSFAGPADTLSPTLASLLQCANNFIVPAAAFISTSIKSMLPNANR